MEAVRIKGLKGGKKRRREREWIGGKGRQEKGGGIGSDLWVKRVLALNRESSKTSIEKTKGIE